MHCAKVRRRRGCGLAGLSHQLHHSDIASDLAPAAPPRRLQALMTVPLSAADICGCLGGAEEVPRGGSAAPPKTLTAWLTARRSEAVLAADAPTALVRWVLQTPHAAPAADRVSIAMPLRQDSCWVSHAIFDMTNRLEASFLMAGLSQLPPTVGAPRPVVDANGSRVHCATIHSVTGSQRPGLAEAGKRNCE